MKTWVRKSLNVGVLSAGIILFAGGTAQAADWSTTETDAAQAGNQISSDLEAPVGVCGASADLLREAASACAVPNLQPAGADILSMGNNGVAVAGRQIDVPVEAIDICGNAVQSTDGAVAGCDAGVTGQQESGRVEGWQTGNDGLLTVCGDTHGLLGHGVAGLNLFGNGPARCDGFKAVGLFPSTPWLFPGRPGNFQGGQQGFQHCGPVVPTCGLADTGGTDTGDDNSNATVNNISNDGGDSLVSDLGNDVDTVGDVSIDDSNAGDVAGDQGAGVDLNDGGAGPAGGDYGAGPAGYGGAGPAGYPGAGPAGYPGAGPAGYPGAGPAGGYGAGTGLGDSNRCGFATAMPVFHAVGGLTRLTATLPLG